MEAHTLRVSTLPPLVGGGEAFRSVTAFKVSQPALLIANCSLLIDNCSFFLLPFYFLPSMAAGRLILAQYGGGILAILLLTQTVR
jgi:hypothetical protein